MSQLGPTVVLYTSPLQRCVQTATLIGKAQQLEPMVAPELNDIDYGAWQGVSHIELARRDPARFAAWMQRPDQVEIPGGESLASVAARVTAFVQNLVVRHAGETVILVSHDSVNRVLLLHALGLPLSRFWRLGQDPCAVNRLSHGSGEWTVHSVNETAHLRQLRIAPQGPAEARERGGGG